MKRNRRILLRAPLAVAVALFLILSPRTLAQRNSVDHYRSFYENSDPEWYGIIDLWHIVGVRPYQGSMTDFLKARAEKYCAARPGVHIRVTGMSEAFYEERVARGEKPDGYSFPAGFLYREQLKEIAAVQPEYISNLRAAEADGAIYAVPYYVSAYVFLTNVQLVPDAPATDGALPDEALLQAALTGGSENAALCIPDLIAAGAGLSGTPAPYERFAQGKAAYAAAELRALGEIARRTKNPLTVNAVPFPGISDLAQFLGVSGDTDEMRAAVLADFFSFLLTQEEQTLLPALGALPARKDVPNAVFSERVLTACYASIESVRFPDAFLLEQQSDALLADAARSLAGEDGAADSFSKRLAVVFAD